MKDVESSGARVILPLVGIVFLLLLLWFVWSVKSGETPATNTASTASATSQPASTPANPAAPASAVAQPDAPKPATPAVVAGSPSDRIYKEITSQQLVDIMTAEGYSVKLDGDDVNWKLDGSKALILTYDNGKAIQFYVGFADTKVPLKELNEWNRGKRFSRAYLDDEGDPCLELDLDLAGGITHARLLDFFKTCKVSFSRWHKTYIADK